MDEEIKSFIGLLSAVLDDYRKLTENPVH